MLFSEWTETRLRQSQVVVVGLSLNPFPLPVFLHQLLELPLLASASVELPLLVFLLQLPELQLLELPFLVFQFPLLSFRFFSFRF